MTGLPGAGDPLGESHDAPAIPDELEDLGLRGVLCIRGSCPRCRRTVNLVGHDCGREASTPGEAEPARHDEALLEPDLRQTRASRLPAGVHTRPGSPGGDARPD